MTTATETRHSKELFECITNAVNRYSDNLIRVAFTYTRSVPDAEDIVQEVFLAYLRTAPVFESDEHEKAWLLRVTVNKSRNYVGSAWFRNRAGLNEEALAGIPEQPDTPEDADGRVLDAVLSLDEKYRTPVHLFYYEGCSTARIGKILGLNPATVSTRLARARKLLKKKLEGR